MERTLVRDLRGRAGQNVRVCGWAHEVPDGDGSGGFVLRDHTGTVALITDRSILPAPPAVTPESAVVAVGTVADEDGRQPALVVHDLRVVGPAVAGPLPVDEHAPLEQRLDWRYLDLRRPRNRLIFEVQTTAERAMREWWAEHGFIEIHSPKLRSMPNQSGRELFTVQYFDA
ncbi:MAG: amino acid--tRNA ligase-related protein, partial [Acidimicrobiales bacterium]